MSVIVAEEIPEYGGTLVPEGSAAIIDRDHETELQ
jgi:hypothetical protein